jgi:ribosomal protein S12 methylthiotransferase
MTDKKINLISLGCPKNLVDSENLLGLLNSSGYEIVESPEAADVVLVNTCAFITSAVEEAIENLLAATELKKSGQVRAVVALGCLPERYKNDLVQSLPEVDLFWGTGRLDLLPQALEDLVADRPRTHNSWPKPGYAPLIAVPRLRSAPFYRAYLKIAEGCSNACSYCLIPTLRGRYQSRPLAALLEEARALAASGVKELILVAQDTTAYGRDLTPKLTLSRLLNELVNVDGLEWIRLMYAYPTGLTKELMALIARESKICSYLDLPLQHVSPSVLTNMKRKRPDKVREVVARLRDSIPGLALRTTLMVGFPGETDGDFEMLMDFVRTTRFEHLGAFKFSPEDGVPAANLPDQVPPRVKEVRRRKLMSVQRRISREASALLVGKTQPVLVEGLSPETDLLLVGRLRSQAPEIDGQVYLTEGAAGPGDIVDVLITRSHDYDLEGRIL